MNFKTLNIVAAAAMVAAAMVVPAYAQLGSSAPAAAPAAPAARAPAAAAPAAPAAPANRGPMGASPSRGAPPNAANFSRNPGNGNTNFSRNGNTNFARNGNWSHNHHRRGHWNGFAFVPYTYGPDYYDDYAYEDAEPDCALQRQIVRTESGRRQVRWVQVCDQP